MTSSPSDPAGRPAILRPALAVLMAILLVVAATVWINGATPPNAPHDQAGHDQALHDPQSAAGSDTPVPSTTRGEASQPLLVHMGDSFASGAGVSPLAEDSPFLCQRSQRNFGEILARRRDLRVIDVACGGATTSHLRASQFDGVAPQLDAVPRDTDYVTIMIGGNNAGLYTTMVEGCARLAKTDPTGAPCRSRHGSGPIRTVATTTRHDVTESLRRIRERAPRARVLIVGYPRLLPTDAACRPAVGIADGDVAYLDRVLAALNAAIAGAARDAGAEFVDMADRSVGHDACRPRGTRWIEPQVGADSAIVMHPSALGQRALADAVDQALT